MRGRCQNIKDKDVEGQGRRIAGTFRKRNGSLFSIVQELRETLTKKIRGRLRKIKAKACRKEKETNQSPQESTVGMVKSAGPDVN